MTNIFDLLFPQNPKFPNTRAAREENLVDDGLTMGTLIIGHPGTGKTTMLARHIVDSLKRHPDQAIFVLDKSGNVSNDILHLIAMEPDFQELIKDVIYDRPGDPEWTLTNPDFVKDEPHEIQVQRVAENLSKLSDNLVKDAPFVAGLGLREIAPQVFRLAMAGRNEHNECLQITEAKYLLTYMPYLTDLCDNFGMLAPQAKWFLEQKYMTLTPHERELRTYSIIALLGAIETDEMRARFGYYRRSFSVADLIKNGGLYLGDFSLLTNQKFAQDFCSTQIYSQIISEINKREPNNPNDKPVKIVLDELSSILENPAMADEVGKISPLYRSRKLQLYVVIQALWQLSDKLKEQIWSLGNSVVFQVKLFQEAYTISQELFPYQPESVKAHAKTSTSQDLYEPDRGQYLQYANQIQNLQKRECVIRRYLQEARMDKYTYWVKKTKEIANRPEAMTVKEIKDYLLMTHGVRKKEALDFVNTKIPKPPEKKKKKKRDKPPKIG